MIEFPTDEDFEITRQNLQKSGLTQIHTFPYSIRQGTVGAKSSEQVDEKIKEERATIVKKISAQKLDKFITNNIGKVREVLVEKRLDKNDKKLKGVTRNYLTIHLNSDNLDFANTIQKAKITEYKDEKIYGELI
jgi:threonylcarbamoyladenosine tRNA methylthiotransferase MtaB